jgi:PAS domain-containing protein
MWFSVSVYSPRHGFFVAVFDVITERKQAEERLRDSEARFRSIFERAAVGVAQIDTSTGRFIRVNKAYADIFGCSLDEWEHLDFLSSPT